MIKIETTSAPTPSLIPPIPSSLLRSQVIKMQNKHNFPSAKMNVTTALTTDYQNTRPCRSLQNKPNLESHHATHGTPPPTTQATTKMQNKPNFPNVKMNLTTCGSSNYENLCLRGARKNEPNFKPGRGFPAACVVWILFSSEAMVYYDESLLQH